MPNKKDDKLTLDKAIAKYNVAINKNISESEVLWSRYNTMLVFNSILIAAIGLSYQDNIHLPYLIKIFLPIAGLITCYLWYSTTSRGFKWIEYWIIAARKFEEKKGLLKDDEIELNPIVNGNEFRKEDKGWLRTENASKILILLIVIIYVIFLFYSLGLNFSSKTFNRNTHGTMPLRQGDIKHNYNTVNERDFPNLRL